jgi:arsenate reductase-like glutaredoxin family protein
VNIQIFGVSKSADTRKAERYFKERRIKFQSVDMKKYALSGKEFDSVLRAVGGIDKLVDWDGKSPELDLLRYMGSTVDREDKVFDHQELIKLPVVRNGKQATVGYCPEIWATWE